MPKQKVLKASATSDSHAEKTKMKVKRTMLVSEVKEEYSEYFSIDDTEKNSPTHMRPQSSESELDEPIFVRQGTAKETPSSALVFKNEEDAEEPSEKNSAGIKVEAIKDEPFDESNFVNLCTSQSPETASTTIEAEAIKNVPQVDESNFFNPKWRVELDFKKGEVFDLPIATRRIERWRVKPFPITVDEDRLHTYVSEQFFLNCFGGKPQNVVFKIDKKAARKKKHPYYDTDFAFLNPQLHPYAPQRPGFPGLYYRARAEVWPTVLRLFIRVRHNQWLYLGDHRSSEAEPLTHAEWTDSPEAVKNVWPDFICDKAWGRRIRNRIAVRKRIGSEPEQHEYEDADHLGKSVKPSDVKDALDSGKERLETWVLQCIGYDYTFHNGMLAKWSTFPKHEKPKKKSDGASAGKSKGKRRREEDLEGEEDVNRVRRAGTWKHTLRERG